MNEWQTRVVVNILDTGRDVYIFRGQGDAVQFLQSDNTVTTLEQYARTDDVELTICLESEAIQRGGLRRGITICGIKGNH